MWAPYVTALWALLGDALWDQVGGGGGRWGPESLRFRYRLSAMAMAMADGRLGGLRDMAKADPSERVTAREMERVLAAGGPGVPGVPGVSGVLGVPSPTPRGPCRARGSDYLGGRSSVGRATYTMM